MIKQPGARRPGYKPMTSQCSGKGSGMDAKHRDRQVQRLHVQQHLPVPAKLPAALFTGSLQLRSLH